MDSFALRLVTQSEISKTDIMQTKKKQASKKSWKPLKPKVCAWKKQDSMESCVLGLVTQREIAKNESMRMKKARPYGQTMCSQTSDTEWNI